MDGTETLSLHSYSSLELAGRAALAILMAIFIGLAFEDVYKSDDRDVPGGIRTFPLLTLGGAALYIADPVHTLPFVAGLLGVAAWHYAYLSAKHGTSGNVSLMIPATSLLVFGLGPLALRQPAWMTVAAAVITVLLLGQREHIHRLVKKIPPEEVTTAGKFLILAGVIFPLVPKEPVADWLPLTPYKMWLALLVVSGLSYVSYLLQRYLPRRGNTLLPAILGGSYSSTITTVVLARRQKELKAPHPEISAGIVAATTMMYIRVAVVMSIFNAALALSILPFLGASIVLGAAIAVYEWKRVHSRREFGSALSADKNPLGLGSAAVFVALLVLISVFAKWAEEHLGHAGIMILAVISGTADIDPFILNLVQGGTPHLSQAMVIAAILLAIASNNFLKAGYAAFFGGAQTRRPALLLATLALSSLAGVGVMVMRE